MKQFIFSFLVSANIALIGQTNFSKHFNEAGVLMDAQKYSEASEQFSKAIDYKAELNNNYKLVDAYLLRGFCKHKLNHNKAALDDIDLAKQMKPEYIKVYQFKSFVYMSEKMYDKNLENLEEGLKHRPDDVDLLTSKANCYFFLKKYIESSKVLNKIIEDNPKETSALKYLGSNYLYQKKWDSSVIYFKKVVDIDPLDYAAYYDLGISKSYTKDFVGAKADIEKAMQIDTSTRYIGYNNLGFFLKLEQADYQGAIDYFNKALSVNPEFGFAYSNRGFAKLMLGDLNGAYKDVRKSIEMNKDNSYAYKNLAKIYIKDGKKTEGCESLKKAKELGYEERYDDEVDMLLKENCK